LRTAVPVPTYTLGISRQIIISTFFLGILFLILHYNRWNTGNDTVAIIGKIPAMPTMQQATTAKTTTNNQTSYPSPYDGVWG
jgi:hypothetical protein